LNHRQVEKRRLSALLLASFYARSFMMRKSLRSFRRDDRGAAAIEYAVLVALIALAFSVGAGFLGQTINNAFNSIGQTLESQVSGGGNSGSGNSGS
jgi:pilus assembly protein Flp/PilA